ncbi:MAG: hypothetical protein JSW47_02275 [Phycisphaerales bacterium]|nr:MAG: hypothetical protein JSW47_02275 [Phycisphaerales bacterium]
MSISESPKLKRFIKEIFGCLNSAIDMSAEKLRTFDTEEWAKHSKQFHKEFLE